MSLADTTLPGIHPLGRHPPPPMQTHPGRHPLGRHSSSPIGKHPLLGRPPPWTDPPPPLTETATAADGTHPTGMHSCWELFFFKFCPDLADSNETQIMNIQSLESICLSLWHLQLCLQRAVVYVVYVQSQWRTFLFPTFVQNKKTQVINQIKMTLWRCLTCWPVKLWRRKMTSLVNKWADWPPLNYHKILISFSIKIFEKVTRSQNRSISWL